MTALRQISTAPLNRYISRLYYHDQPMPYPREKIWPIPWMNLKINFGGAFQGYEGEHATPLTACTDSWSVGLWSAYHVIEWPEETQFFMVDFKPGGAYPFLRLSLSELHNQVVPLDMIWGQFAAEIRERLYDAPGIEAGFDLLERLLLDRLCEPPYAMDAVQFAIAEIARNHGVLSIRALSDQIGMSQKHLIAQFNRLVGTTPKALARLYRFQHVLHDIDPAQPADWTAIAHQSHYYDQSHFYKDFEAFTGCNPADYLRLRRRVQAEHPAHAQSLLQLATG